MKKKKKPLLGTNLNIDLGWLQVVRSRHSKSAEFLNVLNNQVIPSMDFFFPDASCIFQDDNAKINRVLTLTPLKVFGVKGKD